MERVTGKLEDLITAGEIPDILMSGLPGLPALQELKVIEDLSPFIKKELDLSQYNPDAINAIKTFSDTGEMLAIPFRLNVPALFYNKDIFDMFGIPYPHDGMTWEEATSLARTLTRNGGGVQYTGLLVGGADRMAMGLVLPYVDKKTNKAVLETDGWQRLLKQYNAIYSLPGYITGSKVPDTITKLMKDKTDAMATFPQGLHQHTKYDQKGRSLINAAADSTVIKGININTALRDAQEKLDQYITEQNAK